MTATMRAGAPTDLFGMAGPPMPDYADGIVSEIEACELVRRIDEVELSPFRFQQWTGKRLTHSFGWRYDFESGEFARADPIPEWLGPLKARAAFFADLQDDELVQALLIRYDPGAGIGWHRDRPVFEHVVGISLGVPATLRFRRRCGGRFERLSIPLAPRSVYHLSGELRHEWEHSIAEMEQTRWSVTFRSLSGKAVATRRA